MEWSSYKTKCEFRLNSERDGAHAVRKMPRLPRCQGSRAPWDFYSSCEANWRRTALSSDKMRPYSERGLFSLHFPHRFIVLQGKHYAYIATDVNY